MIILRVQPGCRACELLREELDELAIGYELAEAGPTDADLPPHAMRDDEVVYRGHVAVAEHLAELARLVGDWTWFQSDICYFEGACQ